MNIKIEIRPGPARPEPRCIVCTKRLHPDEERFSVSHAGNEYSVCCVSCSEKFRHDPALYTAI